MNLFSKNSNDHTRTEYAVLNIATGVGGYILNTILGFICRMVFVRCLPPDYLGVNGLFTNIISMLSLAELGVGGAVVYALYKPLAEHNEEKIASLVRFYGKAYKLIGIVIGLLGIALIPFLNLLIKDSPDISESIYLLYLINLFNTASTYFFSYRTSLIIAAQQNYIVTGLNYLITIAQSLIQIVLLIGTHNYLLYLMVQTLGTFSYNALVSKIAVKKFPYIISQDIKPLEQTEQKSIFANIRDLMIYKVSGLLVNSTDDILITFFNGLSVTGITSNYTLLTTTLNSLLGQIFNSLTATVGNHNALESRRRKFEMFSFLNMMNFWIYGWAALGIIFCSTDLVRLCFGPDYVLPIEIPVILAINFYSVGMMNAIWTYKHTMGLFKYGRTIQIFTGILNIVFSIALGKAFGVSGILIATFFARLFTNLWYDPYVVYKFGFHKSPILYLRKYIKNIFLLGVAGICCYFPIKLITGDVLIQFAMKAIVCTLLTNIIFILGFYRTKEFKKMKNIVKYILELGKH